MFTPSATIDDIISFVVETVKIADSNPCPPVVLGVGIGSDFEGVTLLSKKALCRDISVRHQDSFYKNLEEKMLLEINKLNIGAQGFGGDVTALAVNIETAPTHIAGLPVAVNVGCHVTRHKEAII
jgi:fumarate hydratase subunit alpha